MNLERILEAILFAVEEPQTSEQIAVAVPRVSLDEIQRTLEELQETYEREERGWRLVRIAEGWQLVSAPSLYSYVERFLEGRRRARLSRAALEALAVVAYRQPITRGEIEDLRGVDCGGVLHTLLEREMITVKGRSNAIGRPLLYATTQKFLEHFGLTSLEALPRLEEMDALWASDEIRERLEAEADRRFQPETETADGGPAPSTGGQEPGDNGDEPSGAEDGTSSGTLIGGVAAPDVRDQESRCE